MSRNAYVAPAWDGRLAEQTGERTWAWEISDGLKFRRLSTVFACLTADADALESSLLGLGMAHPNYPMMRVDPERTNRGDRWSSFTFFNVDFLGAKDATDEAALFTPKVTVEKARYNRESAEGATSGSSIYQTPTYYLPILTIVHAHRVDADVANYAVYIDPPQASNVQDLPFYARRVFVMTGRVKVEVGGYWVFTDTFMVPARATTLGSNPQIGAATALNTGQADLNGCTQNDTFQDRLERNVIMLTDYAIAQTTDLQNA